MATATPFWNRCSFVVITGASRGIGRHLAIKISNLVASSSTLVLLARSTQNLDETKKLILTANPNLDVQVHSVDLCEPNPQQFDSLLTSSASGRQYDLRLLVHNAGSIIVDVPASKLDNIPQFNEYMAVNLYSTTALTASFLRLFAGGDRCIVNISSLYGIQPGKGLVHYCVAKASREMYFRVLSAENPELSILSYSPGPIDTDMFRQIATDCWHDELKKNGQTMLADESTVKVEDSVQKLVDILEKRAYTNGGRVDFYDRMNS